MADIPEYLRSLLEDGPYGVEQKDTPNTRDFVVSGPGIVPKSFWNEAQAKELVAMLNAAYLAGKEENSERRQ